MSNFRDTLYVQLPDHRVWLDAVFDPLTALEYDGREDRRWATLKGIVRVLLFPLPSSLGAETMDDWTVRRLSGAALRALSEAK